MLSRVVHHCAGRQMFPSRLLAAFVFAATLPVLCAAQNLRYPVPAPSDLEVHRPSVFGGTLELTWENNQSLPNSAAQNAIYRSVNNGSYERIATVAANTTSFTVEDIQRNRTYRFKVRVEARPGSRLMYRLPSAYSNSDSASYESLSAPTNFSLSQITSTSLTVQWDDNADAESGHEITWNHGWDEDSAIAAPNQESFTITGLEPDENYTIRIRAVDASGAGSTERMIPGAWTFPSPLQDLATQVFANHCVRLSWTNTSSNHGIEIEVTRVSDGYQEIYYQNWPVAGPVNLDFCYLEQGAQHRFRVRYYVFIGSNGPGVRWNSPWSAPVTATP